MKADWADEEMLYCPWTCWYDPNATVLKPSACEYDPIACVKCPSACEL